MSVRTHDWPRLNALNRRLSRSSDFWSRSSAACISAVFPLSCSVLARRVARPPSSSDRTCFSIEPGIYLEDFGVRCEIDVVLDASGPVVHTPPQTALVRLAD